MGQKARQPVNRERIVEAALSLVEEHGLEGLSMRKLGAALDVEAMTLYYHVASKSVLLDMLVERIVMDAADTNERVGGNWRTRLESFARRYHNALVANPRLLPLIATRPVRSPQVMEQFVHALKLMTEDGFTPVEAYNTLNALALMAIGHALAEVGQPPQSGGTPDAETEGAYAEILVKLFNDPQALADRHHALFEFALTMFLDGLSGTCKQGKK